MFSVLSWRSALITNETLSRRCVLPGVGSGEVVRNFRSSRSIFNQFLRNIIEVFGLDYGELYGLDTSDKLISYEENENSDQKMLRIKSLNQLMEAVRTLSPKALTLAGEVNPKKGFLKDNHFIAYPLVFNDVRLGVLVLGGKMNGIPNAFEMMGLDDIQNLTTISAKALYREQYPFDTFDNAKRSCKELLIDLYGHDHKIGAHSQNIANMSEKIARETGCSQNEIEHVRLAACLHDIGKLFIPHKILNKPGPLTLEEWTVMKKHPEIGAQIVSLTTGLMSVADVVCTHHEHYDGSGYPYGLSGEDIPLASRILSVVDAFGAMTEKRIYQRPKKVKDALSELDRCSGKHFDPIIVKSFIKLISNKQMENLV